MSPRWGGGCAARQPVRLADGRPEGGCTDAYELICCECGDDLDLDHRDVAPLAPRDAVIHPSMGEACARFVRNRKAYRGLSPQSSESGGDRHVPHNPSGAGHRSQPPLTSRDRSPQNKKERGRHV